MFIHLVGTPQININQPARDLINPGFNDRHYRLASSWHPSVASFLPLSYGRMISRDDSWSPVITNLTCKLIDSHFPKQPIFFLSMCTHSQRSQIGNVRQKSLHCVSQRQATQWVNDPRATIPQQMKKLVGKWIQMASQIDGNPWWPYGNQRRVQWFWVPKLAKFQNSAGITLPLGNLINIT